ncbi:growth/differentiation factor 8-like [Glandiceps talaboti]
MKTSSSSWLLCYNGKASHSCPSLSYSLQAVNRGLYNMTTMRIFTVLLIQCFALPNVHANELNLEEGGLDVSHTDHIMEKRQPTFMSAAIANENDDMYETPVLPTSSATRLFKTCKKCIKEDARKTRLEFIKEKIMRKLGLNHQPQVNASAHFIKLPPLNQLLEHEQEQANRYYKEGDEQGDQGANRNGLDINTEIIISLAEKIPYSKTSSTDNFYFKFSPKVRYNEVAQAHLWVYVQQRKVLQDITTRLNLFRLKSPDESKEKREQIETRKIDLSSNDGEWHSFDITHVVKDWFADTWSNWGIEVEALDHDGNSLVVTTPLDDQNPKRPFLEIRTHREGRTRGKRSANIDCPADSKIEHCCRHPLTVNFGELGMDFILLPAEYEAYYCTGKCQGMLNSEKISSYTYLLEKMNIDRCCSPNKMSTLTLLYRDDDSNLMMVALPDMVVESCDCS